MKAIRIILWFTVAWTFCLAMLGAYVRLNDAGLGCPDWPGCYGRITPPQEHHEIAHAEKHFGGDVDPGKGWKEMIHRYAVGGLSFLLLGTLIAATRKRKELHIAPAILAAPVAVIVFQALLGMWTVTMKLMPIVVTAHLVGGLTLLASITVLAGRASLPQQTLALRNWVWLALAAVAAQIVLGGWVSSNYAALACDGFPACRGGFAPPEGLLQALHPDRQLGLTADGQALTINHLAAIHWLHRLGALLVTAIVGALAWSLRRSQPRWALLLGAALFIQLSLGIINVAFGLPMPAAVAHNGGAGALIILLTALLASTRSEKTHANISPELALAR
ncbi:cytochrome c oxidase assembly protein subunit 15 [Andreprevotia lacus DSM 23236]|jgi:cytochrome c oxidase assembly protein subunit 15|uniref:Cytochrome c oxidase assembly protein subunit 15 n=1 Tax=Andreprevotia lacus DSM 23236 TaxID=1121001 RepID=A0A1W1XYX4_9NEIS|nr:COX15/CtaA family protein [Andreprevotia lacus]SMC29169.1 cytochrome c oxidase assembly protein subunit 15 [Andreprevotia lacus DSM 23236]